MHSLVELKIKEKVNRLLDGSLYIYASFHLFIYPSFNPVNHRFFHLSIAHCSFHSILLQNSLLFYLTFCIPFFMLCFPFASLSSFYCETKQSASKSTYVSLIFYLRRGDKVRTLICKRHPGVCERICVVETLSFGSINNMVSFN